MSFVALKSVFGWLNLNVMLWLKLLSVTGLCSRKGMLQEGEKKKTVKMQESQFKMKTSPWSMIGHFKTQTNRKWWDEVRAAVSDQDHGRRWGQCQWRSLQSGSKQAALHHHHYHPAASITGHGPAAHSSDAEGSSYFGNLGAAVRKCYNCSFTVSTTDMTAVAQWGGGHTSRHPGLGNNQCCVHCFLSSSVHWWRSWAKTWGWW